MSGFHPKADVVRWVAELPLLAQEPTFAYTAIRGISTQLIQEHFCLIQVGDVEALRDRAVDGFQEVPRLDAFAVRVLESSGVQFGVQVDRRRASVIRPLAVVGGGEEVTSDDDGEVRRFGDLANAERAWGCGRWNAENSPMRLGSPSPSAMTGPGATEDPPPSRAKPTDWAGGCGYDTLTGAG